LKWQPLHLYWTDVITEGRRKHLGSPPETSFHHSSVLPSFSERLRDRRRLDVPALSHPTTPSKAPAQELKSHSKNGLCVA
jgi:hypothetical protein